MDYIISKIAQYIKDGKNEEAMNLLSLYRMTIESMSIYNPNYIELINPKFERSLFKRFKEWQKTQKKT